MSLFLIPGNSGGGKTTFLFRHILEEAAENPSNSYLVIVPEQFTLETQRDLVRMHPGHSLCNVDILSFQRLAHRLMEEAGKSEKTVLDDTGKNFLISRIAEKHKDKLKMLGGALGRMGYIDEIKSFLSELMQYGLDPDDLGRMEEEAGQLSLRWKLEDLELVYRSFLEEIEGKYSTSEGILAEVGSLAAGSAMLKGAVLAFDGFTGFTPVQVRLLGEIMKAAKDLYVTLTADPREGLFTGGKPRMEELFYLSRRSARILMDIAKDAGQEVEEPIWQCNGKDARFKDAPALFHLEQNLFRPRPKAYRFSEKDAGQVQLWMLPNPVEELKAAASRIRELVDAGGCTYGDFAVVTGALDQYEPYVNRIFTELDIPYFMDRTKRILYHPFVDFVRGLLGMLADDFPYRRVMGCLRSGFFPFTTEEVDQVDNYILATGIRGWSMWDKAWRRTAGVYSTDELKELNGLRKKFLELVGPFREACGGKGTILEKAKALCHFLDTLGAAEKLEEGSKALLEEKEAVRSREEEQIYQLVMQILERLVNLLGDQEVNAQEFLELLEAGFSATPMRVAPPQEDAVLLGDIERTRLTDIRGLFLIGANDGILPNLSGSGGILSELERRTLKEKGENLAYSAREQALLQNFYLYQNLTKPREFLCISWSGMGLDASALRRSFLVSEVAKLFPEIETRQIANGYQKALTPKASLSLFAEDSAEAMEDGQPGARWKALSKWYGEQEGWKDVAGRIRDASYGIYEEERLRREVAGTLYGDVLRGSISRLEQFASCPCSYFLRYGLSLQERPIASFKASDRGSLFHDAIRIFTNRVKELGKDFHSLSGDEVDSMADFSFEAAFSAAEESLPEQDASGKEGKESMKRVFRRTAQTVVMQVKAGAFEPAAAEMPFRLRLPLSEGRQMDLHGIVDRLDEAKAGEKTLLRIVDYKSSARKLELDSLYYGLSLQLFLYMQAALEKEQGRHPGQDFVPAGVFYYDMEDPLVPVSTDEEAKSAEEKIIQQLRLSGLFKGTEEVVNAMDSTPALTKSRAVLLALKKDGSIDESKSSAVAEEDFAMLAGYSLEKAKQLGGGILEGDVEASPARKGQKTGCDYCPYSSICGFDVRISGYSGRKLPSLKDKEVLAALRQSELEKRQQEEPGTGQEEGAGSSHETGAPEGLPGKQGPEVPQEKGLTAGKEEAGNHEVDG